MSSETSTEPQIPGSDVRSPGSDALHPWQLFTLAGLLGATITVFLARGESPAGVILLSLTIFAAAAVGVAALRTFIPFTTTAPLDATHILGGRTRAALEREKALVLRSIKELEFDRSMGKVSDKDFAEMGARLRSRAARLMRQLDAGTGYRDQIEREITRRLGGSGSTKPDGGFKPQDGGSTPHDPPHTVQAERPANVCVSCATQNDMDARFCKACGKPLEAGS